MNFTSWSWMKFLQYPLRKWRMATAAFPNGSFPSVYYDTPRVREAPLSCGHTAAGRGCLGVGRQHESSPPPSKACPCPRRSGRSKPPPGDAMRLAGPPPPPRRPATWAGRSGGRRPVRRKMRPPVHPRPAEVPHRGACPPSRGPAPGSRPRPGTPPKSCRTARR